MANYETLKAAINAAIYTNTHRAITGDILNAKMDEMIDVLGAGYQYMGQATPSTDPGTPDCNVVYLAATAGTYTNFGGLTLGNGKIAFFRWNGTWQKDEISVQAELTVDPVPTSGSGNPVASGGVFTALSSKQATLESGVNIKTVNDQSLLGSGNIHISGGDVPENCEVTDNKVTTITSSSTNVQYPSAKAVYDYVEELEDLIGDIDTVLDNIID